MQHPMNTSSVGSIHTHWNLSYVVYPMDDIYRAYTRRGCANRTHFNAPSAAKTSEAFATATHGRGSASQATHSTEHSVTAHGKVERP